MARPKPWQAAQDAQNALIDETIKRFGLTIESVFVPWSRSRSAREAHVSLNWVVTLRREGRAVLATDYTASYGTCPAYSAPVKDMGGRESITRNRAIREECEVGRTYRDAIPHFGAPILPEERDVIYSLVADASVLDSGSFEEWCNEFGYEPDSRSAERLYRECLAIALKLRAALSEDELRTLREAYWDF